MNSGPTAERVYDALKRRIMDHEFRPGDRLDPSVLAETLASSVTPVRDALHVLTGEGLVETRTSDGFHVPQIDEPALKDLYAWHAELVVLAIRGWEPRGTSPTKLADSHGRRGFADRTSALFAQIARRSANAEHVRAIEALNARLHAARTVEPLIFGALDDDLGAIEAAVTTDDRAALRRLATNYTRRRRRAAAEIVRALYRTG